MLIFLCGALLNKKNEFLAEIFTLIINKLYNIYRIDQFGSMVYEQPSEMGTPFAYIDAFTMSSNLNFHVKHYNERSMIGK